MKGRRYALCDLRQATVREHLAAFRRKYGQEPVEIERWEPWRSLPCIAEDKRDKGPRWLFLAIS